MAAPEQMLKKDLVKAYRQLTQEVKLLTRQLEEKKDDTGEIKGDIKLPAFYFDEDQRRFITAIAHVNLNQLSNIKEHGVARHMAEHETVVYMEDILFLQNYSKEKSDEV